VHAFTDCHSRRRPGFANSQQQPEDSVKPRLSMLANLFRTLTIALSRHKENKQFFLDDQGYGRILTGVRQLKILDSAHALLVFGSLLQMAAESTQKLKVPIGEHSIHCSSF
jgi:hypothetical protein